MMRAKFQLAQGGTDAFLDAALPLVEETIEGEYQVRRFLLQLRIHLCCLRILVVFEALLILFYLYLTPFRVRSCPWLGVSGSWIMAHSSFSTFFCPRLSRLSFFVVPIAAFRQWKTVSNRRISLGQLVSYLTCFFHLVASLLPTLFEGLSSKRSCFLFLNVKPPCISLTYGTPNL